MGIQGYRIQPYHKLHQAQDRRCDAFSDWSIRPFLHHFLFPVDSLQKLVPKNKTCTNVIPQKSAQNVLAFTQELAGLNVSVIMLQELEKNKVYK